MGEDYGVEIRKSGGGETAYVGRSRVRVSDVVRMYDIALRELVIERLCEGWPHLKPEQISGALKWAEQHKDMVGAEIEEEERLFNKIATK